MFDGGHLAGKYQLYVRLDVRQLARPASGGPEIFGRMLLPADQLRPDLLILRKMKAAWFTTLLRGPVDANSKLDPRCK